MQIAFATEDLQHVDAHFGWAKNIAIYDVTPEACYLVTSIAFSDNLQEDGKEDKLDPKLEAIQDCAILYVAAIGGSAAARVVAKNIHPVKVSDTETIDGILLRLQNVLRGTPPPWLRKALNKGRERILNFENEVVHG